MRVRFLGFLALLTAAAAQPPDHGDLEYGPHQRNKLDLWIAKSPRPAPVVVFIHGGGFVSGDKSKARDSKLLAQCLASGVSYASINYRFRGQAAIQDILRDSARAIQFLRYHAREWNIDPKRIGAHGGSAGAGTSLWLAFHDDLADPDNADPVLRESSRLAAAGATAPQASYDLERWPEILGVSIAQFSRGAEFYLFYGFKSPAELTTPAGKRIRADVDMLGLISKDDPPVYVASSLPDTPPKDRGHANHHPRHSMAIKKRCDEVGVEAVMKLGADGKEGDGPSLGAFLLEKLKKP
ncbi:MAG TPA: alpha/beta hydrolase [Bryobacteraceae bacterium]|jgi:acetyl esterase/lipase|nr:alpha/beta hydrolase [Bryobacteraceae bacterium]